MQEFVDARRVPNLVTLVARGGRIVHHHACGVLDRDDDAPAGLSTLFRVWSNTKPVAGVATIVLYERGLLTPDDPVSKFLPEYADQRVRLAEAPMMTEPAKRGITIRDCLTNTTGLVNPTTMPHFYRQRYRDVLTTLGWIGDDANMLSMPDGESRRSNRERVRAQAVVSNSTVKPGTWRRTTARMRCTAAFAASTRCLGMGAYRIGRWRRRSGIAPPAPARTIEPTRSMRLRALPFAWNPERSFCRTRNPTGGRYW